MRLIIFLILVVLSFANCTEKKSPVKPPIEYYFLKNDNYSRLQLEEKSYKSINDLDEYMVVASENVMFNNKKYEIKKYSNIKTAAIDGEVELFFSDTLLLYIRSMNWGTFRMLQTNNDSANKVINNLMGYIMSNPDFYLKEGLMEKLQECAKK